jgi:hypothetical protein
MNNLNFTILKYQEAEWERGCCGDPDRIITDGSFEIELYDDVEQAAKSWADCQWSSANTLLLINGKRYGEDNLGGTLQDFTNHEHWMDSEIFTKEELAAIEKLETITKTLFEERAALEKKAREEREAAAMVRRIAEQKAAEERLRASKLKEFQKLKNELGL